MAHPEFPSRWAFLLFCSQLHLLAQIACRRRYKFLFGLAGTVILLVLQEHHTAAYIPGGDDRGLRQCVLGHAFNGLQGLPIARHIAFAVLNVILQAR